MAGADTASALRFTGLHPYADPVIGKRQILADRDLWHVAGKAGGRLGLSGAIACLVGADAVARQAALAIEFLVSFRGAVGIVTGCAGQSFAKTSLLLKAGAL